MLSKSVGDLSFSDLMGLKRNETISIKYSGYLLKRSNNPWKESETLPTNANANANININLKATTDSRQQHHAAGANISDDSIMNGIEDRIGRIGDVGSGEGSIAEGEGEGIIGRGTANAENHRFSLSDVPSLSSTSTSQLGQTLKLQSQSQPPPLSSILPPIPTLADVQQEVQPLTQQREAEASKEEEGQKLDLQQQGQQQKGQQQQGQQLLDDNTSEYVDSLIIPDLDMSSKTNLQTQQVIHNSEENHTAITMKKPEVEPLSEVVSTTSSIASNTLEKNY